RCSASGPPAAVVGTDRPKLSLPRGFHGAFTSGGAGGPSFVSAARAPGSAVATGKGTTHGGANDGASHQGEHLSHFEPVRGGRGPGARVPREGPDPQLRGLP